jgi:cellobiose transport system substrate-binding protein
MPEYLQTTKFGKITRGLLCVLALLSLSLNLISCASASANGKIQLTLWYWNRSIDDDLIAQVDKVFPNINLTAEKITNYDSKVRTSMAGHTDIPDIVAINSNIATYFPDDNQFVDLRTLGANEIQSQYLPWKWDLGISDSNKLIALPMDTGPTALFYRADIFAKAGLPTDPQAVTNLLKTWNDYIQAGVKIKQATNGKVKLTDNIYNSIYLMSLGQHALQYFNRSNTYIGTQSQVKQAWDTAMQVEQLGLSANVDPSTNDWNAAMSNGSVASFVGAVWMKEILQEAAPGTAGEWRVARTPGGDSNNGGSFLAITKASAHPKEAYEVIKWLEDPSNQLTAYKAIQLFPSAISALNSNAMNANEPFYGGENTNKIFAAAAKNIPNFYLSVDQTTVDTEMQNGLKLVALSHMNPDRAWLETQQNIQKQLLLA